MSALLMTLLGTLAVLVTDAALIFLFTGVGLGLRRLYGLVSFSLDDILEAFWLGLSAAVLLLLAWNFLWPVNHWSMIVVAIAGTAGWWATRSQALDVWRRELAGSPLWIWSIPLACGLWIANGALTPLGNWDSAMYHVQGVRWASTYAVVPGLVNLYGPLALNSASFLYDAVLNVGPWKGGAHHLANSTLVLASLSTGLHALRKVLITPDRPAPRYFLQLVFLIPAVSMVSPGLISSYTTDLPAMLVTFAAATALFRLLTEPDSDPVLQDFRMVSITSLLALGVSFKVHVAVFAGIAIPIAAVDWIRRNRGRAIAKPLIWSLTIALTFGVAWTARGIILSGYPLYPSSVAGLKVDWRAPDDHVAGEYAMILHSGRAVATRIGVEPGIERFDRWFVPWSSHARREPYEIVIPLVMAIVGVGLYLLRRRAAPISALWLWVPTTIAIVQWFLFGPEPRYAMFLFWILAAVACAQAYATGLPVKVFAITLVLLGATPPVINPVRGALESGRNPWASVLKANFNRVPARGIFSEIPVPRLKEFRTDSGLIVNVPLSNGGRCWNAPLPCTPNPSSALRLRHPSYLARGFTVDGRWEMEDWPLDWLPCFRDGWKRLAARSQPQ